VSVDPLGDELAPTVLPDGFIVEFEPFADPAVVPVELPLRRLAVLVLLFIAKPAASLTSPSKLMSVDLSQHSATLIRG
jgi:hypothetical protein